MNVIFGISWNDSKRGGALNLFMVALLALTVASVPMQEATRAMGEMVSVIVRETPGSGDAPERLVRSLGGEVDAHIRIINGFVARVPEGVIRVIEEAPQVHSISYNGKIQLLNHDGFSQIGDPGSMINTINTVKAQDYWKKGITGRGVDIALIDSGVVPVEGLTAPGKVINGPDLSFESQAENLRHLDTFGHGTHLAGIIAGRDGFDRGGPDHFFAGIAPGARLLNVKVANAQGAADVSQVLAAIDWVVQHRYDNGMDVRVLNLSFGTDGVQDYLLDPLTYAAEVAWHKGIVVVVAAGNQQFGNSALNNPAYDPYVIAVGANDTKGTYGVSDDTIPAWSAMGNGLRNPDVVAPGKSVVSLRAPGSQIDLTYPVGRVTDRLFRGSGTSQAAAVVSGAAALVLQQRPSATPDQVKALLMNTATALPAADPRAQGRGMINLKDAFSAPTPTTVQTFPRSTGTGSLEAARGSVHIVDPNGAELNGEQDIFGAVWDGNSWSGNSWSGNSWSGGTWNGNSWSGNSWSGNSWSGNSWSGNSWSGNSWSGNSWSGNSWSGNSWSGNSWSGNSWSGNSWSGNSWSGNSWSGNSWSGNSWSSDLWGSDYDPSVVGDAQEEELIDYAQRAQS